MPGPVDDETLLTAIMANPPMRHLLPVPRTRRVELAMEQVERHRLYQALSSTDTAAIRALRMEALVEPLARPRGSVETRDSFVQVPEAARMVRHLLTRGWPVAEVRDLTFGLHDLWEALDRTCPDGWRVADVVEVVSDWHGEGRPVAELYRALAAVRALWESHPGEEGRRNLVYLRSFLDGLLRL